MSNTTKDYGLAKILGGLAAGAALGVLFAPRSGKETRALIGKKATATKEQMDELIAKARVEWSKARGKAVNAATMTRDEADDLIRFILSEGEDLWSRVTSDAKSTASEVTEKAKQKATKVHTATPSDN